MIRWRHLEHRFVELMPERLEPGVLYVSMEHGTAAHGCCCGCGAEIVTPFTPTDWRMTYDGEAVSLWPSVGNWSQRCRSHYIIDRGRVIEASPWSDAQVAAERRRDRAAKERHYETSCPTPLPGPVPVATAREAGREGWWARLRGRLFARRPRG
jgi:hypothetical protein